MSTSHSVKRGLPPGSIVYVGRQVSRETQINAMAYDAASLDETSLEKSGIDDFSVESDKTVWMNVDGVHDVDLVEAVGKRFSLHPLTMEDIVNTRQRPKFEDFDDYIFLVFKMLRPAGETLSTVAEQVSLILTSGALISFQEEPGDVFETVRERIRKNRGRIRHSGADYLFFSLMDATVDGYFDVLERLGERISRLDDEVLNNPQPDTLRRVHEMKRELAYLRRCVWPLREMVSGIQKRDNDMLTEGLDVYLRDLHDHVVQVIDTVESYRDVLSGLTDLYLSVVSNRMNEVMKVLTLIATIFIPITFVAGIYGMNFDHMPELHWRWSYPVVWLIMIAAASGMLVYFKRKRWL